MLVGMKYALPYIVGRQHMKHVPGINVERLKYIYIYIAVHLCASPANCVGPGAFSPHRRELDMPEENFDPQICTWFAAGARDYTPCRLMSSETAVRATCCSLSLIHI